MSAKKLTEKVEAVKAEPQKPKAVPGINASRPMTLKKYAPGLGPDPNRKTTQKRNPC